jgi:hypothetical protein
MDVLMLLHVLGAMVAVGALLLAATALVGAWRADDAAALRLGYRALLWGAIPAWIVMRVFAQLLLDESGYSDDDSWVGLGYMTSELGLLLLIVATVLAGLSARRASGGGRARAAVVLVGVVLALSLLAIFAMTTKPT